MSATRKRVRHIKYDLIIDHRYTVSCASVLNRKSRKVKLILPYPSVVRVTRDGAMCVCVCDGEHTNFISR